MLPATVRSQMLPSGWMLAATRVPVVTEAPRARQPASVVTGSRMNAMCVSSAATAAIPADRVSSWPVDDPGLQTMGAEFPPEQPNPTANRPTAPIVTLNIHLAWRRASWLIVIIARRPAADPRSGDPVGVPLPGACAPRAIGGSRSGTVAARRDIVCRRIASAAKVTGRAGTADGTLAGARDVACGAATAGDAGARADGRRASRVAGAVDAARVQACARATGLIRTNERATSCVAAAVVRREVAARSRAHAQRSGARRGGRCRAPATSAHCCCQDEEEERSHRSL